MNLKEFEERYLEITGVILNYYGGAHLNAKEYAQSIVRDFKNNFKNYKIEKIK